VCPSDRLVENAEVLRFAAHWGFTSNKSFEEWGEIFGDEVMAAALIDRILYHCHIVNIRGNSFRMRQHSTLWKQLPTRSPTETRPPPRLPGGEPLENRST
jgi:hypothetical protein